MQTILIVEDEKRVADLLKIGLEENGYQTMVAYDGAMGVYAFSNPTRSNWSSQILFFRNWMVSNYAKRFGK